MDFTSRREIFVNGTRILEDTPYHNFGSYYDFEFEGVIMEVVISRSSYFKFVAAKELYVQGEKVKSSNRKNPIYRET